MKYLLIIILLFIQVLAFGQKDKKVYDNFSELDRMPEYVEGQAALFRYLSQHIKYPIKVKEEGDCGKMIIEFIIEKNGKVSFIDCKFKYCDLGCGDMKEAIENMPKWKAGLKNGKPVRVRYKLPIIVEWE